MSLGTHSLSPSENHSWANFMKLSLSHDSHDFCDALSAKDGAVPLHGRSITDGEREIANSNSAFFGLPVVFILWTQ